MAEQARTMNPNWSIQEGNIAFPLPYLLLKVIPYFSISRVPSRFMVITFLGLALLAGIGIDWLLKRYPARKFLLTTLAVFLILLEFYPCIIDVRLEFNPVLTEISQESDKSPVLDLFSSKRRLFHQIQHKRPIIGGIGEERYYPAFQSNQTKDFSAVLNHEYSREELYFAVESAKTNGIQYLILPSSDFDTFAETLRNAGQLKHKDDFLAIVALF
jgi:hypothetical protein